MEKIKEEVNEIMSNITDKEIQINKYNNIIRKLLQEIQYEEETLKRVLDHQGINHDFIIKVYKISPNSDKLITKIN